MAFAKEEAKTWKFGELSLKAGDVLGKDTEIKNDAENREIRILSEKTNLDEKKDDKERIKTEKEAVIAAAASWNLKDLTEKAKKAPADYLLKKADSWNGSWIVTKIAETETKEQYLHLLLQKKEDIRLSMWHRSGWKLQSLWILL